MMNGMLRRATVATDVGAGRRCRPRLRPVTVAISAVLMGVPTCAGAAFAQTVASDQPGSPGNAGSPTAPGAPAAAGSSQPGKDAAGQIGIGSAYIATQGCLRDGSTVRLGGAYVESVSFYLDGRKLRTLRAGRANGGSLSVSIDAAGQRTGAHRLVAKIRMLPRVASLHALGPCAS